VQNFAATIGAVFFFPPTFGKSPQGLDERTSAAKAVADGRRVLCPRSRWRNCGNKRRIIIFPPRVQALSSCNPANGGYGRMLHPITATATYRFNVVLKWLKMVSASS
jgi:hypothetical protein